MQQAEQEIPLRMKRISTEINPTTEQALNRADSLLLPYLIDYFEASGTFQKRSTEDFDHKSFKKSFTLIGKTQKQQITGIRVESKTEKKEKKEEVFEESKIDQS